MFDDILRRYTNIIFFLNSIVSYTHILCKLLCSLTKSRFTAIFSKEAQLFLVE